MKIGIIYCGYNQRFNIEKTLSFWNDLVIPRVEFIVSVVSVPFVEYRDIHQVEDGSRDYINGLTRKNIKNVNFEPRYVNEITARGVSLNFLSTQNVEFIWQVDSDEYYTKDNVNAIINVLRTSKDLCYSINFKNYIFDGKHYVDNFCVRRINRVVDSPMLAFLDDNTIFYESHGVPPTTPIPKSISWVKHMTWLHEHGKQKVEYQMKHFGECGFSWNEEKNQLEINLDYYRRRGCPPPKIQID